MRIPLYIFLILLIDTLFLTAFSFNISISRYEADIFFNGEGYLNYIVNLSTSLFGQNDFALRAPFIVLHILNCALVFLISRGIVKKREDIILVLLIFMLLPGVNTSALIVSKTGVIIFFTLLFVYMNQIFSKNAYYLLLPIAFLDNAFLYLFVSLIFYAHYKKEYRLLFFSILSFAINYSMFGFDVGGIPEGYFLDIFSTYAAVFSPFVFLFFIYSLYWQFEKARTELHVLWFISAISFLLSLILSLRQNIKIEDFAPYAVIYVPFIVYAFYNSYRIRLPEFRRTHKAVFGIVLTTLLINTAATFYNKPVYLILKNPEKHFAYEYHFTNELAQRIKDMNIKKLTCESRILQKKLLFYGIEKGDDYILTRKRPEKYFQEIPFFVFDTKIESFYLLEKASGRKKEQT